MTINQILNFTRHLCDANSTTMPAAALTDLWVLSVNAAYEEAVSKLLLADGRWQFDDNNFTTFPVATTTLVASQRDYQFDTSHLKIERVEVLDQNGNYYPIEPIDQADIPEGTSVSEFFETAGQPRYYDLNGSSVVLYPAPDNGTSVTLAAGLKVYFQRTADTFTVAQISTGTKVPGFASPFHEYLAYKAAIPYCMKYKPERVAVYTQKANEIEQNMILFYTKRNKDDAPTITVRNIRHR